MSLQLATVFYGLGICNLSVCSFFAVAEGGSVDVCKLATFLSFLLHNLVLICTICGDYIIDILVYMTCVKEMFIVHFLFWSLWLFLEYLLTKL